MATPAISQVFAVVITSQKKEVGVRKRAAACRGHQPGPGLEAGPTLTTGILHGRKDEKQNLSRIRETRKWEDSRPQSGVGGGGGQGEAGGVGGAGGACVWSLRPFVSRSRHLGDSDATLLPPPPVFTG